MYWLAPSIQALQAALTVPPCAYWIPACAGMTVSAVIYERNCTFIHAFFLRNVSDSAKSAVPGLSGKMSECQRCPSIPTCLNCPSHRLLELARRKVVAAVKRCGIALKQTFATEGKTLFQFPIVSRVRNSQTKSFNACEDVISRLCPIEWFGIGVVKLDIVLDRLLQLPGRAMRAAPDLLFGQRGKPALDLVEPAGRSGREVNMKPRAAHSPRWCAGTSGTRCCDVAGATDR